MPTIRGIIAADIAYLTAAAKSTEKWQCKTRGRGAGTNYSTLPEAALRAPTARQQCKISRAQLRLRGRCRIWQRTRSPIARLKAPAGLRGEPRALGVCVRKLGDSGITASQGSFSV